MKTDYLTAINSHSFNVNHTSVPTTLFANSDVAIDQNSLKEAIAFSQLKDTLDLINNSNKSKDFFGDHVGTFDKIILTPDFHKGAGIPVGTVFQANGFVLPKSVGNDIACGMQLIALDLKEGDLDLDSLSSILRYVFFEGGRNIALTSNQRLSILREGISGLFQNSKDAKGILENIDFSKNQWPLINYHCASRPTTGIFNMEDYVNGSTRGVHDTSHDDQLGSIGGGNHFVELQVVDEILDTKTAWQWGVKRGQITLMVHSGSVGIGHLVGTHFMDLAKKLYPQGIKHPTHDYYVIPTGVEDYAAQYISAMNNAANFAFANRFFLGLMAIRSLEKALQRQIGSKLIYDAPHNLIWSADEHVHLHRKGACPAGLDDNFPEGHPVIVPGSMGDSSFLMKGLGNDSSYCSCCHGAGRLFARNTSRKQDKDELKAIRVVTKINKEVLIQKRPDLVREFEKNLMEEAPSSYKPVLPVINTVEDARIAKTVARMRPLLTIKG